MEVPFPLVHYVYPITPFGFPDTHIKPSVLSTITLLNLCTYKDEDEVGSYQGKASEYSKVWRTVEFKCSAFNTFRNPYLRGVGHTGIESFTIECSYGFMTELTS